MPGKPLNPPAHPTLPILMSGSYLGEGRVPREADSPAWLSRVRLGASLTLASSLCLLFSAVLEEVSPKRNQTLFFLFIQLFIVSGEAPPLKPRPSEGWM